MNSLPRNLRQEVKEEAENLEALGFEFTGIRANGHLGFAHPDHGKRDLPYSPSERQRWRDNSRAQTARQMGITKTELELRCGIRQEKRMGPKIRRRRNDEGRRARTFQTVEREQPKPDRVGTPRERLAEIAQEIGAATQGLNYASGDEYDSLLSELARLRSEYCQLEADSKEAA